jgi:hypothetical protein
MKKDNIYYNHYPDKDAFHLAAIIPATCQPLDFHMPWFDCFMPIAKNYLAVERAVYEALYAGSDTIWIVCSNDISPILKDRIGELAYEPKSLKQFKQYRKKEVPIYYIAVNPKDYDTRDSLSWNILYGASVVYKIFENLTKWVTPTKFLVTFPFSVYPAHIVGNSKSKIFQPNNFYLSYNNETVKDGKYLSFTFEYSEIKQYMDLIRNKEILASKNGKIIRVSERFTGRFFTLKDIFGSKEINERDEIQEVSWYYNIDNWEDYCIFLSSQERKELEIPNKEVFTNLKWNPMGIDDEEIEEKYE